MPCVRHHRLPCLAPAVPIAAAAVMIAGCGGARAPAISVFPVPGSRVVSPLTQIAFRGLPVGRLGHISVIGSRSGVHTGRVRADADGDGGSFLPTKPFLPGERVTVRTSARLFAGRASVSFTIADPAPLPPTMSLPPTQRVPGDVLTLRSRPDLAPAAVEITRRSARAASGEIFLAPQQGPVQSGPMILDPSGALVWFHPLLKGVVATDFRVQRYAGRPVLTWWQGRIGAGIGAGEDVILDSSYRRLATVRAANGLATDLHEFLLIPHDRALITAYYPVYWDASSLHGPKRAIVLDSVVQEIDVRTGLLLFQWDSLDHVPLADTHEPLPRSSAQPIDYFHVNSIQLDGADGLIISARNTWAAYKVSMRSGRIVWTLGGKHSTFRMAPGSVFAFQHDVRVRAADDRTVTVFDDGAGPPKVHRQSRGVTLELDVRRHTAHLIGEDRHSPALLASYEGNVEQLPNGDQFLGWGQQPYFTEFAPSGQTVFDGRFVGDNSSYRAYRFPWRGTPRTLPAVFAAASGASATVYVSWNGATEVSRWQVLTGADPTELRAITTARRQGFETKITVPYAPYVVVRALDEAGRVLSTSLPVKPG
jgi:hypothetical protein